jgi:membrane associated rhomboid family serine protease
MGNSLESSGSSGDDVAQMKPPGWFKVGTVAAASALAGGLLAAWWYSKTLKKLRQAEEDSQNPHFGILDDDRED